MNNIRTFLAHAIKLEAEAARRSDELADLMATHGNREVEDFFRQMADYSRLHLKEAMSRAGFRYLEELPADGYVWPDGESPESAAWWGIDGMMDVDAALVLMLESEKRGMDFYCRVAEETTDFKVQQMAEEFAREERAHVIEVEQLIARRSTSKTA